MYFFPSRKRMYGTANARFDAFSLGKMMNNSTDIFARRFCPQEISSTGKLQIYDEIPYLRAEAQRLKRDGINIIIAVGHSGFERDIEIAKAIPEISVVVGGHSHSLLYTPKGKLVMYVFTSHSLFICLH